MYYKDPRTRRILEREHSMAIGCRGWRLNTIECARPLTTGYSYLNADIDHCYRVAVTPDQDFTISLHPGLKTLSVASDVSFHSG